MVRLDSRTGCVDFYSGSAGYTLDYVKERGRHRPAVLSDYEVARLARTYMGAADSRLEGVLLRSVEVQDDPLGTVVVSASPTYRGVPFGGNTLAIFELDPLTGRLNTFMHGPRIAPPDSVVPQIGLEAARDVALEELARFHGATQVREIVRLELCIVRPVAETRGLDEWFTPSQLALGAAYRGVLAYGATYGGLDSLMEDGTPFHQYRTLVDAQTGRVLALWHMRPLLGGGGSAKPVPFAWNLGPAPILLAGGAWSGTVNGAVDLVPPPRSFHADRRLG
ncbi:MAG: hypothetical protein KIS66_17210 [Fimbriimonadaceae bacterium]|nr:hypothetical protein [Fimbriimonadaceae bacterium]